MKTSEEPERRPTRITPEVTTLALGLVAVALFLYWAGNDAGSAELDWLLGAPLLAGLLISTVIGAAGIPRALARGEALALASFVALTGFAYASILWAEVRGDGWNGANRSFLYLATFALFLLVPWRALTATTILTVYAVGVAAIAAVAVASTSNQPERFIDGRLSFPTGYPNANAGLFLSAFWVAVVLATRRTTPTAARVACGASAALLPQVAVLSQSRGSVVAFVATAIVVVAVIPGRLRSLAGIMATVSLLALTWSTHLRVFDEAFAESAALDEVLRRSSVVMLATVGVSGAAVFAWGRLDARVSLSARSHRLLGVGVSVVIASAGLAAALLLVTANPIERGERAWQDFTSVDATDASQTHLSLGVGSNRYDFWRVALSEFRARPVLGVGADNFAVSYVSERRSGEEPSYPHSLWIMLVSQFGVVGTALFLTFLACAGNAALPRRRDAPAAIGAAGAAVAGFVYFGMHASVDWFWEIPGLGAPAMAMLGLAASVRSLGPSERPVRQRLPRPALAAIVVVFGLGGLASLAPWLAEREIDRALASWRANPASAYQGLERARALNPLSARPDLLAGVIAARLDDRERMGSAFARSLERNPYSWYANLELGLAESLRGNRDAALRLVRRAGELNPREPVIPDLVRRLEQDERISPSSLDQLFVERIKARTG